MSTVVNPDSLVCVRNTAGIGARLIAPWMTRRIVTETSGESASGNPIFTITAFHITPRALTIPTPHSAPASAWVVDTGIAVTSRIVTETSGESASGNPIFTI